MIRRVLKRSLFYYLQGTSLLTLPLVFLAWAEQIYTQTTRTLPTLKTIFPTFPIFLTIGGTIIITTSITVGYIYYKKSFLYQTNQEINTESNPFSYQAVPGKEQDIYIPINILSLNAQKRLMEKWDLLTPEDSKLYDTYLEKLRVLQGRPSEAPQPIKCVDCGQEAKYRFAHFNKETIVFDKDGLCVKHMDEWYREGKVSMGVNQDGVHLAIRSNKLD